MKRLFLILGALAAITAQAKTVTGHVSSHGSNLSNVAVSDGYNFALTDTAGRYSLEVDPDAYFVFVVTPSGYIAPSTSGTPEFYRPASGSNFDFDLLPWGTPGGNYTLIAMADTQPRDSITLGRLYNEALTDIRAHAAELKKMSPTPIYGMVLGDITFDRPDLNGAVKNGFASLGFPVMPVIGNHDHDMNMTGNDESEWLYRQSYGPNYYAFNAGKDYFIVLDDIMYDGNRKYNVGFDERQLQWVEKYLSYVPKDAHIFVGIHAPLKFYNPTYTNRNAEKLAALFSGRNVDFLSGHTHVQYNYAVAPGIREYNICCIGGPIWMWDSPLCKDGTPNGYQVFIRDESNPRNYFKASGYPADYQMKAYLPGTVAKHEKEIVVKCWNVDERWKLEWCEDGSRKGTLAPATVDADPEYSFYLQNKYLKGYKQVTGGRAPNSTNSSIFYSYKPSDSAKTVEIKATDPYGQVYTTVVSLR